MSVDKNNCDVIIVGAGISGLMCASRLQKHGVRVLVLEKSRGVGGRMATRRIFGGRADHGAQYFTCRDARFQRFVDRWLEAGVIREWFRHLPEDSNPEGYPRYCGSEGMTSVPKFLAEDLTVHCNQTVNLLSREDGKWTVSTSAGQSYSCKEIIITAPVPQAAALIDNDDIVMEFDPGDVCYEKGIAVLVHLDGESGLPGFGGLKPESEVLSWVADNRMKEISGDTTVLTLHSTAAFAELHWDDPDDARGKLMINQLEGIIKARPLDFACHRWRYTTPINPLPERYRRHDRLHLTFAGDAYGGLRVESAALSGLAAADALLAS